jgi:hypothetical protein
VTATEQKRTVAATFVVDFPCERLCRVEFDLTDVHVHFRYSQMLQHVTRAHAAAHAVAPTNSFQYGADTMVRAGGPR